MINAAKKLIQEYKNITLENLIKEWNKYQSWENVEGDTILNSFTGFGDKSECPLCVQANKRCEHCIHKYNPNWEDKREYPCLEETYDKIEESKDADSLYEAIQERINYLEKLISYAEQQTNSSI